MLLYGCEAWSILAKTYKGRFQEMQKKVYSLLMQLGIQESLPFMMWLTCPISIN